MFKVGDWAIHRMGIGQIVRVDEKGNVREFTDGSFSTSSSRLNVRPLTLRNKRMAETFKYYEDEIRKMPGENALNWPDISAYLAGLCLEAMDTSQPEGELNDAVKRGQDFVNAVRDQLRQVDEVDGIRLFKNR